MAIVCTTRTCSCKATKMLGWYMHEDNYTHTFIFCNVFMKAVGNSFYQLRMKYPLERDPWTHLLSCGAQTLFQSFLILHLEETGVHICGYPPALYCLVGPLTLWLPDWGGQGLAHKQQEEKTPTSEAEYIYDNQVAVWRLKTNFLLMEW